VTRRVIFVLLAASLLLFSAGGVSVSADPPAKADPKKGDKGDGFAGRTKEGKARLLKEFGGSEEGEEAVMLGLAWLTQVQKQDGSWVYDNSPHANDFTAATGMAVLAFLGAGQSHKEGRYKQTVQAGLDWLVKDVNMSQGPNYGKFNHSTIMYTQGIATLALCEAYGMTRDPELKKATQAALDYIQRVQRDNGSWGYDPAQNGDTSIVGWQIQALHAAQLTQDLVVNPKVIEKAIKFLDRVSPGQTKSTYGYADTNQAAHATSLTAIGLLCRYYIDHWRADNAAFAAGAKGLMRRAPNAQGQNQIDLYYYYYATQVIRFYGGEEWKTWNEGPMGSDGKRKGGLPDQLLALQNRTPAQRGSWDPAIDRNGLSFGPRCGRLGATCMCLLTLEVYYRYAPESKEKYEKDDKGTKP
jgi:hypothetical protein